MVLEWATILGQDDQVIAVQTLRRVRLVPQVSVGGERDLHLRVHGLSGLEVDEPDPVVDDGDEIRRATVLMALGHHGELLGDGPHPALLPPLAERFERGMGHREMIGGGEEIMHARLDLTV